MADGLGKHSMNGASEDDLKEVFGRLGKRIIVRTMIHYYQKLNTKFCMIILIIL